MSESKRSRKEIDYKEKSSSEDEENYEIPEDTSGWRKKDIKHFNIKFVGMDPKKDINNLPDEYKNFVLEDWDESKIKYSDTTSLDKLSKSIINKLRGILGITRTGTNREIKVDSFIYYMFNKLGLNDDPFDMFAQYKCGFDTEEKTFTSKPDFIIFKDNSITIIIEDKHRFNAGLFNEWGEYQTIGEIITCAAHVISEKGITESFTVNAIRVIGTKFTFYKANVSREYILESYELKSKSRNSLIVERYPVKNKSDVIGALNFCNIEDRLNILKSIYSISL
jgi:hypothetical protein